MSAAAVDSAMELHEVISLSEAVVQEDGTVLMDVIRPGLGRGRGRRLYEAPMLERNAGVFVGWKMYVDHLSDQARRALGGLPRSIRDLAGRVVESWWDPTVPADPSKGWGQGAVRAKVKLIPYVRELVEHDPELIEGSINGDATSVRRVIHEGAPAALVEGIKPKGSFDLVTEAGAGGRVVALMEATYSEGHDQEAALLETLTDDELRAHIAKNRPELLEALTSGDNDGGGSGNGDGKTPPEQDRQNGGSVEITPEALREALETDEGQELVATVLTSEKAKPTLERLVREIAEEQLPDLVESALADERDEVEVRTQAHADRRIELRDLRDRAHALIENAGLPEKFAEQSKSKFDLTGDGPTPSLDVLPEIDSEGSVVKDAVTVLNESVNDEIKSQRDLIATINPTRVRGQGASGGDGGGSEDDGKKPVGSKTAFMLREAGFEDPDKVYAEKA
jgi:hypothetical protein